MLVSYYALARDIISVLGVSHSLTAMFPSIRCAIHPPRWIWPTLRVTNGYNNDTELFGNSYSQDQLCLYSQAPTIVGCVYSSDPPSLVTVSPSLVESIIIIVVYFIY